MGKRSWINETSRTSPDDLLEVFRASARRLIGQALEAEVLKLLADFAREQNEQGRCPF